MAWRATYSVDYIASNPRGENGNIYACAGIILGDDGVSYAVMQGTTSVTTQACFVFKLSDGSVAHTITPTTVTNAVGTYTYTNSVNGGAVGDGRHIWAFSRAVAANRYGVAFWYIDSGGSLAVNGTGLYRSNAAGAIDDGDVFCAGLKGTNLICLARDGIGLTLKSLCVTGPGITTVENGVYAVGMYPWDNRFKDVGNASIIEHNIAATDMHRPVEGALFWVESELYGFFSKGDCDYYTTIGGASLAPLSLEAANYSDGFIAKFSTSIVANNGFDSCSVTAYTVDNSNWQNFPFDDGALRVDGVTQDFGDDYQRQPIAISGESRTLVTFLKVYDADAGAGGDLDPSGKRFRVRAYSGNPTSGWTQVASVEGVGYDVVSDAGVGEASRYSASLYPVTAGAIWHDEDETIYIWEQHRNGAPTSVENDYTLSVLGTLIYKKAGVVLNVN